MGHSGSQWNFSFIAVALSLIAVRVDQSAEPSKEPKNDNKNSSPRRNVVSRFRNGARQHV